MNNGGYTIKNTRDIAVKKYMMNSIRSPAEDLQTYDSDNNMSRDNYESMQAVLDKMEVDLERVSNVVQNMSIIQSSFYTNNQSSDINQCIHDAYSVFMKKHDCLLQVRLCLTQIPLVFLDTCKIHQVLINLLTNAATAIERKNAFLVASQKQPIRGEITILSKQKGGFIVVSVTDNGCGIDKHLQEEIFNPCYTTSKRVEGTGLGLAISRDIALEHAGSLTVTSVKREGSVFTLSIPISDIIIH